MPGSVWVELVGDVIVARLRGEPSEAVLRECQERVTVLLRDTAHRRILYDILEMDRPSVDLTLQQQKLSSDLHGLSARIAIVVPNSPLAYLARLAFGDCEYRVFYNDLAAALAWLAVPPP
jgi:hypothetical protein